MKKDADRMNIKVPPELHHRVKVAAAQNRQEMYSLVELAIDQYLANRTKVSQNYDNPSSISPEQKTLDESAESLIQNYALAIGQIAEKAGEILKLAKVAGGHGNTNQDQATDRGTRIARELTARAAESLRRIGRGKGNLGGTAPPKSATAPAAGGSGEKKAG